jgi:hypothetical protein
MAVFCNGLMVGEAMPEEALHGYFCALKVIPILKSFYVLYELWRGI